MKVTIEFEVTDVRCGHPDVAYAVPPSAQEVIEAWAQGQLDSSMEAFEGPEYVGEVTFGAAHVTITP